MECLMRLAIRALATTAIVAAFGISADSALAQTTTYGQDPVPTATKFGSIWSIYGVDPVPGSTYDQAGYVWAYGFDPVPGTPVNNGGGFDAVLPIQAEQVLTSSSGQSSATSRTFVPRPFWRRRSR